MQCPACSCGAFLAVIVLAAVMSTTDRLMLTIGTYFSWDIYKKILKPDAPDSQVLRVSQISVFAAAAIYPPDGNQPSGHACLAYLGRYRHHVCNLCGPAACRALLAGCHPRGSDCIYGSRAYLRSCFGGLSYFKIKIDRHAHALLVLCLCHLGPCNDYRQHAHYKDLRTKFSMKQ